MTRWTALGLALALAGCSSSSTLPADSIHATGQVAASGGALSANYSGKDTLAACGPLNGRNGSFSFAGTGTATFFHQSGETGRMSAPHGVCVWSGSATLTSTFHPANTVTVHLALPRPNSSPNDPCKTLGRTISWSVTSGTGKFAHASGRGSLVFNCSQGAYTDKWSGTLTF